MDLCGRPADYDALHAAATAHDLWVVADAAQSFGGSLNGRQVGTLAETTTTSFLPSRPLGCSGDGGAVLTDDPDLAAVVRSLHLHGRGVDKFIAFVAPLQSGPCVRGLWAFHLALLLYEDLCWVSASSPSGWVKG